MSHSAPPELAGFAIGGLRAVLEASARAMQQGQHVCLALVLDAHGNSHALAGTVALIDGQGVRHGGVGGEDREPVLALHAQRALARGRIEWIDFAAQGPADEGHDDRLRIALLPLSHVPRWSAWVSDWQAGGSPWQIQLSAQGELGLSLRGQVLQLRLFCEPPPWNDAGTANWTLLLPPAAHVLLHGAGPESRLLLPLLGALGIYATRVDRRLSATAVAEAMTGAPFDAVVVMHHDLESDADALQAWSRVSDERRPDFIGLVGSASRCEALFRRLPAPARHALAPRLHAPVGRAGGGYGPEAIALGIATELQHFLQSRHTQ